ncbi:unnamed protein product [Chironomus riparius]|uniref:Elongation of very long chain fatty acids protein n=1 Tax=Chironomus riparius TaxID=315576 RepID=A0A9N9WN76_9DIPT|nr:unnamed protein product [Chironomus riparius]
MKNMNIANIVSATWYDLMENKADPRTTDWFLMSSPLPTVIICLTYVYIVKYLGPSLMNNRKPFELRKLIVFYNFLQVLLSAWLFWGLGMSGWFTNYSYRCQPVDKGYSAQALKMAYFSWWYYFSKFTEFFDTFFFVLRKRYDQVSTLHVIHHGIMPFSVWWGVKFMPGGHSTFFGLLNTFVHIIMYTYYMLAAMGPQVQKYLWWKKYLTMLQMVQFVGIFSHCFQLIFHNPCNFSYIFVWWIGGHGVLFLFLFSNFYKHTYKSSRKENTTKVLVDDNDNVIEWNKTFEKKKDSITQMNKALAKHL